MLKTQPTPSKNPTNLCLTLAQQQLLRHRGPGPSEGLAALGEGPAVQLLATHLKRRRAPKSWDLCWPTSLPQKNDFWLENSKKKLIEELELLKFFVKLHTQTSVFFFAKNTFLMVGFPTLFTFWGHTVISASMCLSASVIASSKCCLRFVFL